MAGGRGRPSPWAQTSRPVWLAHVAPANEKPARVREGHGMKLERPKIEQGWTSASCPKSRRSFLKYFNKYIHESTSFCLSQANMHICTHLVCYAHMDHSIGCGMGSNRMHSAHSDHSWAGDCEGIQKSPLMDKTLPPLPPWVLLSAHSSSTPLWVNLLAVLWNRNYLLRFRFRFRFCLLKSYGSGSGSNFWKVIVPVPTFEKVTVPVPVPAPYLDHKKPIFHKKIL